MGRYKIIPEIARGIFYEKPPAKVPFYVDFVGENFEVKKSEVIVTEGRLKRLAEKLMQVQEFAYDTETTGLRVQSFGGDKITGISISWGEMNTFYVPIYHAFDPYTLPIDLIVKYLKPCFEREDVTIVGHNLKFDMHVLADININIKTKHIFDTAVGRHITDENYEKGLKEMTSQLYSIPQEHFDEALLTVTKQERKFLGLSTTAKYIPFYAVRIKNGAPYASADAYWTWRHYVDWEQDAIEEEGMSTIYSKGSMPFLKTLYNMERRGANIDRKKLQEMAEEAKKDLDDFSYKIYEISQVAFDITSNQQLAEILFGYKKFNKKGEYTGNKKLVDMSFNYPVISTTKTGAPQTNLDSLVALSKKTFKKDKRKQEGLKMISLILKFKKLSKLNDAFITGLLEQSYPDGKVHCSFNQTGTDSGRISCSAPNLQQLPRPIEMDDLKSFEEWFEEVYEEKPHVNVLDCWNKVSKHLKYIKNYPTGEVDRESCTLRVDSIEEYLKYVKEFYKKNKENIFWKYYEIRSCFIPDNPKGESLIALDFSNLEMRLLAHFSGDENLVETFVNNHDKRSACRD